MKKRLLSLTLGGLLTLSLITGCSQNSTTPSAEDTKSITSESQNSELVFVNYRDIRDLNPHLYAGEMYAQSILYDTLVSITGTDMRDAWQKAGQSVKMEKHILLRFVKA